MSKRVTLSRPHPYVTVAVDYQEKDHNFMPVFFSQTFKPDEAPLVEELIEALQDALKQLYRLQGECRCEQP